MDGVNAPLESVNTRFANRSETFLYFGLLGVLIVLLVPLPSFVLDMLLATNIAITILLLLITVSVTKPLEISVFPALLLLLTLFRMSLNVATTRLILLHADAGKIVETFGGFVVGGDLIVGLVIFLILIVIQFIVITKGASRVSEVAARFTLDALPGKQMAIDAELSAGAIDEKTARKMRDEITQEAEFYGAMDGAGKFVRGDAIAGLVITGINIVGGVILGVTNGLTILEAIRRFSILSVGDGLVSQVPAVIIAIAAGIIITKSNSKKSLANEIGGQVMKNYRPLATGAVILLVISFTPGLPKTPFIALAAGLVFASRRLKDYHETQEKQEESAPEPEPVNPIEQQYDDFIQSDRVRIEIGARLIPFVNPNQDRSLPDRITELRRDLARLYGIWVPTVRIRDSISLDTNLYRILINGREVARGTLRPDKLMAMHPGKKEINVEGEATTDPTFGLPVKWITADLKQRAEMKGLTVVDAPTVLITHLSEVVRRFAAELLSREDLQKLLDKVKETSPTIVEELRPEVIRMGDLHQVLTLLLDEHVPLTNLAKILECIVQHSSIKSPVELAEKVREHLGRDILDRLRDDEGKVNVAVLDPRIEMKFRESYRDQKLMIGHDVLERLAAQLNSRWQTAALEDREFALLTDGALRRTVRSAIERLIPDLIVMSYQEVPKDITIDVKEIVKFAEIFPNQENADPNQLGGSAA